MLKNRKSEELNSLISELLIRGYKELEDKDKLGIKDTKVFATLDGYIATINERKNKYVLRYRIVNPVSKGGNKLEFRVYVEGKMIPVHKIMTLIYPKFTGALEAGKEIHHIDCNHLNNKATNLICLSKDIHNKLHSLLDNATDIKKTLFDIQTYLLICLSKDEEITIEGLEESVYG